MNFKLNSEQVEFLEDLINECWFDGCDELNGCAERKCPAPVLCDEKLMHRSAIRDLWIPNYADYPHATPLIDSGVANVYRRCVGNAKSKRMHYHKWMFVVCISRGQRNRAERLIAKYYEEMSNELKLTGEAAARWCLDHPGQCLYTGKSKFFRMMWDEDLEGFVNQDGLFSHFGNLDWTPLDPKGQDNEPSGNPG